MTFSTFLSRLVVLGALFMAPLAPPFVAAQTSAITHAEAGRAFEALRAASPDTMPRLSDAEGGAALRTLTDATRFLDDIRYTTAELSALSDLCDRARAAMVAYIAFGAMQQGQLVPDVMARNAVAWENEIALLQGFTARCIARQVPLAEALLAQMGEAQASRLRLGGLQRSQATLLQIYVVAAGNCPVESPGSAAYCGVLELMSDFAPVHARAMPLGSREAVVALLTPLAARAAGGTKAALQRVIDTMRDRTCSGLCLLQPA